jgi:hypothetical protein
MTKELDPMNDQTFIHYLGKTPEAYTADAPITLERVLYELQAQHGRKRAADLGLVFLAAELRDYALTPAIHIDGAAILSRFGQLDGPDRGLILDMVDRFLQDVAGGAIDDSDDVQGR